MRQSKSAGSPDNRTGHSRTHGNGHAIAYAHPGPNHCTGSYSGANGLPGRDIGNGHTGSLHAYPGPDSNTGANCYTNAYTSAAYTYPGADSDSDTDANSDSHTYAYPGTNCYARTRATHAGAAHVYAHTTHASSAYIHTCAAYPHAGSTDGHTSAANTNTQTAYPNTSTSFAPCSLGSIPHRRWRFRHFPRQAAGRCGVD